MRCLYCGKELALLKRLTGGGEFCSDAHKQSYQEEYNRLALSRLLQAQTKAGERKAAEKRPARPAAPVAVAEPAEEPEVVEIAPPPEAVEAEPEPEIAPPLQAGLSMERPGFVSLPEGTSYVEPWLDSGAAPATPRLHYQNGQLTLPAAQLLHLKINPRDWQKEHTASETDVTSKEFTSTKLKLSVPFKVTSLHEFPVAEPATLDFPPRSSDLDRSPSLSDALGFPFEVAFRKSSLLETLPAGISLPAEDAPVIVPDPWGEGFVTAPVAEAAAAAVPDEAAQEPAAEPGSPRAALEALSRLHHQIIEKQDTGQLPEFSFVPASVAVDTTAVAEAAAVVVAAAPPVADQRIPHAAGEILAMPVKSFPPAKPSPMADTAAIVSLTQPLLPRLKTLPLRPKVAPAPKGASLPAAAKSSVTGTAARAAVSASPARTSALPKPSSAAKQPVQTPPAKQPAAREPAPAPPARPAPPPARPGQPPPADEPTLTFETLQLQLMASANPPFWGTLRFKLGLGAVLVLVGVAYFGFGGKSHKPAAGSHPAADIAGPSIMVGEGGWVQGWAGDTNGEHLGRQITIYRPSLKLSDYRVEFQGEIESKSMGWVFRAADPNNYYALKLAIVAPGLNPKIALLKRVVLNGQQKDVGQVPIDIPARLDTVYSVRVDVRGPKFSTWVQGQPVDVWTDDQIKTGGVGFLNERAERARIKSVSISYLTAGVK